MTVKHWVAFSSIVLVIAAWFLFARGIPDPEDDVIRLEKYARQGDWRGVFKMASPTQQSMSGLTEKEFCTLMSELSASVGPDISRINISSCSEVSELEYRVAYRIELSHSKAIPIPGFKRTYPLLFARREEERWWFDLGSWPIALAWMTPGQPVDQLARLVSAMKSAGVQVIADISTRTVLTPSRVQDVVDGTIPHQEMWVYQVNP